MSTEDNLLIQRAEEAAAEAARLREALEQSRRKVHQQAERLARIEAELDPLLPHPPEELRQVRALLAQDPFDEEEMRPAHAGRWPPG